MITSRLVKVVAGLMAATGGLAIATGLLYLATGLGRHPFVLAWSCYAVAGGTIALGGARWLRAAGGQPSPWFIRGAILGFSLSALGQVPPLWFYFLVTRSPEFAVPPWGLLPPAGHVLLFFASIWGLAATRPAAEGEGLGWLRQAAWALPGVAAVTASPLLGLWALNLLWPVRAEPPPGSVVPPTAVFRFTWPAWAGAGTTGGISYLGDPEPIHSVTSGGRGFLEVKPAPLKPGRAVTVDVWSGFRHRRFTFRVRGEADDRADLYGAALAHWFRPPQDGWSRLKFVVLDGMAELGPEEKRTVARTAKAFHPFVALAQADGNLEPIDPGHPPLPPEPYPFDILTLRLAVLRLPDGSRKVEVVAQRTDPAGRAGWQERAVYLAERRNGAWTFEPAEGSEKGRPFGWPVEE